MAAGEEKASIAYWLMPNAVARDFLVATVRDLAARFDAPIFEPHLTIHVTPKSDNDPAAVLIRAAESCHPLSLSIVNLRFSDKFTKTVFVQFTLTPLLINLSRAIQKASAVAENTYELDPHLSLIYKKMTERERTDIINSIQLPFRDVLFDRLQAVNCRFSTESGTDVERWRVVATHELSQ